MDKLLWDKWIKQWEWILQIAKRRKWDYEDIKIKPSVHISEIEKVETALRITYPFEFKLILSEYSSGVDLFWQTQNEETEGEFREVFRGGGRGYLWDFDQSEDLYEGYKGWVENCFSNPEDPYDQVWHNKVPLLRVMNGDIIGFDTSRSKANCPVIYLSHDDGDLHGYKLADNFIEFVSCWSNIGCVGTEDWQFKPFYDFDKMEITKTDPVIERWKLWLAK